MEIKSNPINMHYKIVLLLIIANIFISCHDDIEISRQDNAVKIASFFKFSCQNPVFPLTGSI